MNFEVNGHSYFLTFAEEEGAWYVVEPRHDSLMRIPVYVDMPTYERFGSSGSGSSKVPN